MSGLYSVPERTPPFWGIEELRDAYRRRRLSPLEIAEEALARIDRVDPALHAFIALDAALTRSQARLAERDLNRGEGGRLVGIPISIKDLFDVARMPTTFGSKAVPARVARRDSAVVARLRAAGAVFTGKSNTAEFGQSATTENLLLPPCRNPWDLGRTAGGSSGGAAASVAAGMSTAALGSDGGGSIRIPAAFTGLVGLKPTHGFCPGGDRLRAMTQFSCPGPLARTVADARLVAEVLVGCDLSPPPGRPLRVGWCPRPEGRPVDPVVGGALASVPALLERLGHGVEEVDVPVAGWESIFGPLVLAEEWAERGDLLAKAWDLTDYERRTLEAGRRLAPADLRRAQERLPRFRAAVAAVFDSVDVVATPATAVPAFPLGRRPKRIDGAPVDALWGAFPFTAPFNVAGLPALSQPCAWVDGLPVGLQLVGPRHAEAVLLGLAGQLEEAIGLPSAALSERWHGSPALWYMV
ncbi:MAG: amidase [Actinobacteria bacterium]|nr:amidase [Actinomycetota bacterium]